MLNWLMKRVPFLSKELADQTAECAVSIRDGQLAGSTNSPELPVMPIMKPLLFEIAADAPYGEADPDLLFDELNPVQTCFKQNFRTDISCVLQAGTGTGKRGILHIAARAYMDHGMTVVITAPTKQLVRELKDECIGLWGRPVVGVNTGAEKDVADKMVIVTTPEGYLSAFRKRQSWTRGALLVVDEAHGMFERNRGTAVDAMITLFGELGGSALLLSGTFPFAEEVAGWLKADRFISHWVRTKIIKTEVHSPDDLDARLMTKKQKDLPVAMQPTMSGYMFKRDSLRLKKLKELLARHEGEQVLVFATTKAVGNVLSEAIVAPFYHSDLDDDLQKKVIAEFNDRTSKVLIATSGLSMGVNTPADVVIVFGCRRGGDYLTLIDLAQMFGRAGRGKPEAPVYLIGDKRELFNAKQSLYSKTLPLPTDHVVLSKLSMNNATQQELADAVMKTFAGSRAEARDVHRSVSKFLGSLTADEDVLFAECFEGVYSLTKLGSLVARYCIDPAAYRKFQRTAETLQADQAALEAAPPADSAEAKKRAEARLDRGCILLSLILQMYAQDCPTHFEKAAAMKLIELGLADVVDAKKVGALRWYIMQVSKMPSFFGGTLREAHRWLGLLKDLKQYNVISTPDYPASSCLDAALKLLEINAVKAKDREKVKDKKKSARVPIQETLIPKVTLTAVPAMDKVA